MDYLSTLNSPVGPLTVASDGDALVGLWLDGQKYFEATLGETEERPELPVLQEARAWLDRYFEGADPGPIPPVSPRGTAFRQRVWTMLAEIPYGQLTTYGELARRIEEETGARTSARAVGGAVGHNPISIILPCHRVVGSTRSLTGYAGGLQKKIALLRLEGVDVDALKVPTKGTAL
ncbi:6-O-methylguanine DNA methyltransferase [Gordonibacter sp. 28C]|uniref:methylated-DNA--[protein]-cysteine S-methyltransferase n=1 Tax=Gordonibacter sp. 28C TaxID=2078569 RepID=UPI000DF7C84F|nr:methylated-DNA--[protein]-cysteine S-methyltransferase [Gordonibacter sp. 28C]RDB62753.1 6-O-methylguanine DNA methyltransferase [Gordonibacter sp. 28C]